MGSKDVYLRINGKKTKKRGLFGVPFCIFKIILKKVALEEAFDAISDGTNISKSKPDPEVFLKAAEYLDLQPEECIVVEDAYAGIDAAKAGNMQAVGTGEAYSYAKADYHIKKIEELLTILP